MSNLRLPWKNRVALKIFTVLNIRFAFRILTTCAFPENRVSPENFHCIEYIFYHSGFLSNFVLALKNRVAVEFFTVLNILLHSGVLRKLHALALKNRVALNSQYWLYIFYHSGFLSNLRFPWKTELPWNFSLYGNICYHSVFLSNLRLAWKTELPWYFHCIKHVFFIFQEFWVTRACPEKNRVAPKIFCCIEDTFYILNFWATYACPEKQKVPWIYSAECIFFIIQEFWITCVFPEKQSCPGIFHCMEYTFTFWIFEQLVLAVKNRGFPEFTVPNVYFLLFRSFE